MAQFQRNSKFNRTQVLLRELRERSVNAVTRLPLRAELIRHVRHYLALGGENKPLDARKFKPFSLLHFDTKNLHLLNKIESEAMGDAGLKLIGRVLKNKAEALGGRAYHLRSGGDEFVMMVPIAGNQELVEFKNKILEEIENKVKLHPAFGAVDFGARAGHAAFGITDQVGKGHYEYPLKVLAQLHPKRSDFLTQIMAIPDKRLYSQSRGERQDLIFRLANLFAKKKGRTVTQSEVLAALGPHVNLDAYLRVAQLLKKPKQAA